MLLKKHTVYNHAKGIKLIFSMANSTIKSLLDLVEEGRKHCNQTQPSILMVPRIYRDQNPSCFDPQVVAIGPLHRGHKNVQEHERLKGVYMHELLARLDSPPQETLERCLLKVNSSINDIKSYYGGWNVFHDFDVAKMMVTDACFILEFIQKITEKNYIFSVNTFTTINIFTDLLLIENQIPFFVLQGIFDLTLIKIQKNKSLITLLLDNVFDNFKPFKAEPKIENNGIDVNNFKHILEILHKSYRPGMSRKFPSPKQIVYHSVVELDLAGVKFKPNEGGNMEIGIEYGSFEWLWIFRPIRKPTLRMPVLNIHDKTELVLRNLIAYEQSYPNVHGHYFTSFAYAMDMLVDSTEDVAKLIKSKVIINWLGSNERATNMINSICNDTAMLTFIYEAEFKKLDDYYKSYWPKHMAWLRRTYFNSPWSVIALAVGILLFALTATQTIFTIISA